MPARARAKVGARITPLAYDGGFDTKTALYETLVGVREDGSLGPALASEWTSEDGGRALLIALRRGAHFHDGSPVDAAAVRVHFERWVGLPEHAWLESCTRIERVEAFDEGALRVRLSEPFDLLPDLLAINPCSITAPAAFDRNGAWVAPVGSGPFRFVGIEDDGHVVRCALADGGAELEFHLYAPDDERSPIDALAAGELDAWVDTWSERLPRERFVALADDARFERLQVPGGGLVHLTFGAQRGPTSDVAVRRRIAAAIDRDELVQRVELGLAAACRTWAPPTIVDWPAPTASETDSVHAGPLPTLRLLRRRERGPAESRSQLLHESLAAQLRRVRIPVEVVDCAPEDFARALSSSDFDLVCQETHGIPYDPDLSLTVFLPGPRVPSADTRRRITADPELAQLVHASRRCFDAASRRAARQRIQDRLDAQIWVVPLYVPARLAVYRKGLAPPRLSHDMYRVGWDAMLARAPASSAPAVATSTETNGSAR